MKIQRKIFLIFAIGIFSLISIGILADYLLLEKYYIYKSQQEFINISQKIQKKIDIKNNNINKYITRYGKKNNVRIIILNSALEVKAISYYQRNGNTNIPSEKIQKLAKEKKDKNYICKVYKQKKSSSAKMFFLSGMKNGNYILLMKNTKKVHESAMIASEFYLITGIFMLTAGLFITSAFSRKITQPVIIMNKAAREMANLNFGQKIPENGKDEIAELAHSINQMSVQLYNCIDGMEKDISRRKQLIRDLSHELKTPVAVIKGYADGLMYGIADNKQAIEKYCNVIANECERIDKMVKEMLELSKLEQTVITPDLQPVTIYSITENLALKYSRLIEEKNCKFSINGTKTVKIMADIKLLERIINNLLGNAVKYVTAGGKIEVNIYENKTGTEFSIFNTGKPVPEDETDKIWDVFYKLDCARKRETEGHGIGLAIVKSAVTLHNGTVFVRNTKGGVIFGCIFPKL